LVRSVCRSRRAIRSITFTAPHLWCVGGSVVPLLSLSHFRTITTFLYKKSPSGAAFLVSYAALLGLFFLRMNV
jgi:hypothetical protein